MNKRKRSFNRSNVHMNQKKIKKKIKLSVKNSHKLFSKITHEWELIDSSSSVLGLERIKVVCFIIISNDQW